MTNPAPTNRQTKLIRIVFYVPLLMVFCASLARLITRPESNKLFTAFLLVFFTVSLAVIMRMVETKTKIVIPTKKEILQYVGFGSFFVSIKVLATFALHPSKWIEDLAYWLLTFITMAPIFLFVRKANPENKEPTPSDTITTT